MIACLPTSYLVHLHVAEKEGFPTPIKIGHILMEGFVASRTGSYCITEILTHYSTTLALVSSCFGNFYNFFSRKT